MDPAISLTYAIVANQDYCASLGKQRSCSGYNNQYSPNDDPGLDAMVQTLAHELGEAITNPHVNSFLSGWNTGSKEMGDVCENMYGNVQQASNAPWYYFGSTEYRYNIQFGSYQYLVQ